MGRAAASRAEGDADPLEELEFHWGSAYDVGQDGGVYTARRRDGKGATLAARTAPGQRDQPGRSAMTAAGQAGGSQPRGVFEVDEGRALAELELTWAGGGYHGFSADGGTWSAISSAGDVLTGDTPDALNRAIRADWAREGTP